jgi:hypothetical protein
MAEESSGKVIQYGRGITKRGRSRGPDLFGGSGGALRARMGEDVAHRRGGEGIGEGKVPER